jgi:hypothetical protein
MPSSVQPRRSALAGVSPWQLLFLLTLAASQVRALYFYLNVGAGMHGSTTASETRY